MLLVTEFRDGSGQGKRDIFPLPTALVLVVGVGGPGEEQVLGDCNLRGFSDCGLER